MLLKFAGVMGIVLCIMFFGMALYLYSHGGNYGVALLLTLSNLYAGIKLFKSSRRKI
ncbi:MAG TPA: hypothetical protein VF666_03275 [Pyrinomonadaceae bacterium]|jgi:hypothetical protein